MTSTIGTTGTRGKLDDTLAAMFSNAEYRASYLFYAHIIGQCSIKIDREMPAPAGVSLSVDHYNLYINPDEFDQYTLKERLAILKHEALHILYGHVGDRGLGKNPVCWNISTDCALNQHIDQEHLPECAILPKPLQEKTGIVVPMGQSAEFYYELLKSELQQHQQKQPSQQNQGNQSGDGQGQSQSSQQSQSQSNVFDSLGSGKSMDTHKTWDESVGDKDLQKDLSKRMIERAQTETLKGKGTIPAACADWIELHSRRSEVNWKRVLRGIVGHKLVGTRSTIMRLDRRFPNREDLRGKTRDRMFNLLVVVDVSGSMSPAAINTTLAEVRNICDITKTDVDLIQVDTVAYEPEKLSKKTLSITRRGAGGTFLSVALDKAREKKIDYQAVVVLTDGGLYHKDISAFAELNKRVIWLIESTGTVLERMNTGKMQAFKLTA
jgi:predicted metal-dependent peptidase